MAIGHEILTVKEVGALLKVAQGTVYKLVKEGRIPAFKIGGDWRFRKDVIKRCMVENTNWPPEQTTSTHQRLSRIKSG